MIAAQLGNSPGNHSANVHKRGFFPFLADDDVSEAMCDVSAEGPVPRPAPPLAPDLAGLVAHVSAYERVSAPPVFGAALSALGALGASEDAHAAVRACLT